MDGFLYIAPLQVHYYSEALPTQHRYCVGVSRQSATGNCERKSFIFHFLALPFSPLLTSKVIFHCSLLSQLYAGDCGTAAVRT